MLHSLYVFSKRGTCLFYVEWHRPRSMLAEMPDEDRKLMFGLVFSLKQLMNKMNPNPCVGGGWLAAALGEDARARSLST